ncbi:uncharacterized protein BDW70DRAFT_156042 [Aspergillus foveolatus]|uniref:uncharacterized protein n=1 Tax=Aspergillus foveolatus TaxID=210207 RepID=UPI003CCD5FB3
MKFPKIYNTCFVAFIATVGGMLFGFDISSMSAIIGTDQYNDYFDNPAGLRRRDSIAFACIWWFVGTAVQIATNGFVSLIAGRVLNGVCVGITSSQVPVYLAEIAKKEKRGQLIVIQQLAIEWGILILYFVGSGCSFIPNTASFRTAWGIQFLAKVDRSEEAIATLANIQAGGNRDDPLVNAEWEEITMVLQAERNALPGWRKFVYNGMLKRTLAVFTVQMWQQDSGANVMTYYVVYIFMMANLTGKINLSPRIHDSSKSKRNGNDLCYLCYSS